MAVTFGNHELRISNIEVSARTSASDDKEWRAEVRKGILDLIQKNTETNAAVQSLDARLIRLRGDVGSPDGPS